MAGRALVMLLMDRDRAASFGGGASLFSGGR